MKKIFTVILLLGATVCAWAQDLAQQADSLAIMREEINQLKSDYADLKNDEENNKKLDETKRIWKRNKFFRVGYAATSSSFQGFKQDNKGGVFFNFGTSFLYPKQPIANFLKVGFDVIWFDFTYGTLKNNGYRYGDFNLGYDDDYGYDDDEDYDMDFKMKPTFLTMTMGIGPNVTATPFYMMDNALKELKVRLYGHYRPGVTVYFVSEDGDTEAAWAYTGWWDFGVNFSWKVIGVGVEGSWGNGNFKSLVSDFDEDEDTVYRNGKRSFASCRVYLSLNF